MPHIELSKNWYGAIIVLAFIALLFIKPITRFIDDATSPQPWFTAGFDVPNFEIGQDPEIAYHLRVNRPVRGQWFTSIYAQEDQGQLSLICSGGGYAYYQIDTNGTTLMPLSRFIGSPCNLRAGSYRICTNYDLEDESDNTRTFGPFCDMFRVSIKAQVN